MKRTIPALALTIFFAAFAEAQAAEEEQDWYAWYEQQSAQAAAEEARQYAQYYEAASPDQQPSPNLQDEGAGYDDVYADQTGDYNPDDPYANAEPPDQAQAQATQNSEDPEWVWSADGPTAIYLPPENPEQEQQSE